MKRYGYFLDLLKLDIEKYPVIAVVGGGGKTSLIYRLNEELQALGKKVIISTTTHMAYDTNEKTHEIIRNNLERSPLYSGNIKGTRLCSSCRY